MLLHVLSRPSTTYAPQLRGSRVRRARSLLVAGGVCFMVDAGGMCTCMVSRVLYTSM